jgi:hypothetical protein
MDFIQLIFGKDLTSITTSILGYLASAAVVALGQVLPGVTGTSSLTQVILAGLAALVAVFGRVANTKA